MALSKIDAVAGWVLRGALGFIGATYVGYPLAAFARARIAPRPHRTGPPTGAVSVIVAAHNEAAVIADKVRSVRSSSTDDIDLEVIVADDGSDDGTAEAAEAVTGTTVLRLPRGGKAAALRAAVAVASGDILVFTDADSMFGPATLKALLSPFADPQVGGVAGDQRYEGDRESLGERAHWSFDRALKQAESIAGSTVSATGALYAIRTGHFSAVPAGVTDDFYISTGVVADGARLVFAPDAVVTERAAPTVRAEYDRKVRVMTRGLRAVAERRQLLHPRFGAYAVSLAARKVARRLTSVALVVAAIATIVRPRRSVVSSVVAVASVSISALGAVGWLGPRRIARLPFVAVPTFVCASVVAALRALGNLVRGVEIAVWDAPADALDQPSTSRE